MAIIKIWTNHKSQREFVLKCNAGIDITNDGIINVRLPKNLAKKLGFNKR